MQTYDDAVSAKTNFKRICSELTEQELAQEVIWWQKDAGYSYAQAAMYRDRGRAADQWISAKVQLAAAHSAQQAREYFDHMCKRESLPSVG